MKQHAFGNKATKQLVLLVALIAGVFGNAFGQFYSKVPSVLYRYNELSLGTAKTLIVQSNMVPLCQLGTYAVPIRLKKATVNFNFNWNNDYSSTATTQYTVNYTVACYSSYTGTGGLVATYNASLAINNTQPQALVNIDFSAIYSSIVRIVVTPVLTTVNSNATQNALITSDVGYSEEFENDVYTGTSGVSPFIALNPIKITGDNLITFSWALTCDRNGSAPNYEFQLLKLYNSGFGTRTDDRQITADVDWSQALSIETGNSKSELTLTMAEGVGYYLWRVRPIGNAYEGGIANDRNWGAWTGTGSYSQAARVATSSGASPYLFYFSYNAVDPYNPSLAFVPANYPGSTSDSLNDDQRNWIFQRHFVEGDKVSKGQVTIGESVSYANRLQMANQQQSRMMSNAKKVISQSIYDYSGRVALNVLPTPVNKNTLAYEPAFIRNNSNQPYSARDFDYSNSTGTGNYNDPAPMDSLPSGGGLGSPSMYYSSNNDNEDNIPTAAGYPFSRTVFSRDGKNTVVEASMPGKEHRLNPASGAVKHTSRVLESGVADMEVIRILGDEAPDENTLYKTITIDPNNTASVAYISKEGKTIATCLSGSGGTNLQPLASASSNPFTATSVITSANSSVGDYAFHAFKTLALTEPTAVTLIYTLTPNSYSDPTCLSACSTCDYKVTFRITDNSGETLPVITSMVIPPASSGCSAPAVNNTTVVNLQPGSYTIERIIEANTSPSGSSTTYLNSFIQAAQSSLSANLLSASGTIVDDAGNTVAGAPAVVLQTVLNLIDAGNLANLYTYLGAGPTDTHKNVKVGCNTIRIPIWPCEPACDPAMNFEAYFFNLYTPSGISGNQAKLDQMFGVGTYAIGEFNDVIQNMKQYGGYSCEQLWSCWKGTVAYFMAQHNVNNVQPAISVPVPGGGSFSPTINYLDQFLSCTGYKISGIKTIPGSGVGVESSGGYKSHPYKWMNYSSQCCACEVAFVNTYNTCGTAIPPGCPVTITGTGATCGTAASFITWFNSIGSPLPLPCASPSTDNKESFYRCVINNSNSGYPGACSVQSTPNHVDLSVADDLRSECRRHCEGLYSEFVTSEIALVHNNGIHVAGDKWELVAIPGGFAPGTVLHVPNASDVPLSKIYCNADAMERFCKSQCVLTVQSPSGALGSAAEIAALQQLLTGKFVRSSAVPCSPGNTNATQVSDSLVRTLVLILNHGLATQRQQATSAGTWWDFKVFLNSINPSYAGYFSSLKVFIHPDVPSYFAITPGVASGNRIGYYFNRNSGNAGTLSEKKVYSENTVVSSGNFVYSTSATSPASAVVSDPGTDYLFSSSPSNTFVPVSASAVGSFESVPNALSLAHILSATSLRGYTNGTTANAYWTYDLCSSDITGSNAPYCDASVCFTIVPAPTVAPPDAYVFDGAPVSCEAKTLADIANAINTQISDILNNYAGKVRDIYKTNCIRNLIDRYTASYQLKYHHYTLYYYDRAGNLVKTVPPAGVTTTTTDRMTHPAHAMVTEYAYNSLGQLLRQKTPDGGETNFWYDAKGRLRFSQNAKQRASSTSKYSYTKYDALGRITDVGEIIDPAATSNVNQLSYPTSGGTDITRTFYSTVVPGMVYPGNRPQRNLQNRVSYSFTDRDGNTGTISDLVATYYSYDPHGNVEWIIQDIPELGKNYIAYEYDLASGSVLKVSYNENSTDRFYHRYTYDADKRLKTVETSIDNLIWEKDARYDYYLHGPLKRAQIGHDGIQGLDYVYTINGWLKSLNGYAQSADPGGDGSLVDQNMYVPRDAYMFVLGYHQNDYYSRSSQLNSSNPMNNYTSTGLYNGNISSWQQMYDRKAMDAAMLSGFAYSNQRTARTFQYDQLNRLKQANFMTQNATTGAWTGISDYQESFSYDANGNLMNLQRFGKSGNLNMDNLTYNYYKQSGGTYAVNAQAPASVADATNRLAYVTESYNSPAQLAAYADDIDGQSGLNYTYDEIGNLTADPSEGLTSIKWNVYGKIAEINKTKAGITSRLTFLYDAAGNRVYKKYQDLGAPVVNDRTTYYVKDASGNSMAVYERTNAGTATNYTATYKLKEHPIYGSERIGTQDNGVLRTVSVAPGGGTGSQPQPQPAQVSSYPYLMIPFANSNNTQVYSKDIYTVPSSSIVLGPNEYVQTVSGGSTVDQASSQAMAFDEQGNVVLSAFTYKLYNSGVFAGNRTALYANDSYQIPGVTDALNNSADAQAAFLKKPGSEDEYYYFTIGTNGKPYYHTIDLTAGVMLDMNNEMDSNSDYGQTMALFEDQVGNGPSTLYLRRFNGTNTYLKPFTITAAGISAQPEMLIGAATSASSVGEIRIAPSGSLMAIANSNGSSGEVRLYSLSTDHQSLTAVGTRTMTGKAVSVEFSDNDASIFVSVSNTSTAKLFRLPVSTFLTATPTQMHSQSNPISTGAVRRGMNGKIYYITNTTAKPGEATLNLFTDPNATTTAVTALLSGVVYGSLPMTPIKIVWPLLSGAKVSANRVLDNKDYELKDHLGNVHATVRDYKVRFSAGTSDIAYEQNFNDGTAGGFALASGAPAGSTVSNAGNRLAVYGTGTGATAIRTISLPVSTGGKYLLSFDYLPGTCTMAQYEVTGINASGNPYGGLQIEGRNDFMISVPSGVTSVNLKFTYQDPAANHTFYIDNILIKQLDAANATLIATPLAGAPSNWIGTNLNVSYPGSGMKLAQASSGATWYAATKSVNLMQDQLYKITVNVSNLSNMNPSQPAGSNKLFFGYENDEGTAWLDYSEGITGTTTGNYTYYVVPKTNRGNIFLGISNGGGGYFECEIGSVTVEHVVAAFQPMYSSVLSTVTDYYAFGSPMPGRNFNSPNYRYGFNGKENDNEVKGNGNQQDYGLRIYDPRLGRFLSVDPLAASFAWNSPYCFAENTPIWGIDLDGGELKTYLDKFKKAAREALGKDNYEKVKQRTDAAASAALIKTAKTIYPEVDKANEATKQTQFKTDPENSVAILLYEFATGTGKDTRTFNYGTKGSFANSFIDGRVLKDVSSEFKTKMGEMTYDEFKESGAKFGLEFSPDQTGLQESIEKHLDSNLPQFFVGGANVSVSATDDENWVNVTITNNTSRSSLMLHGAGNYKRDNDPKTKDKGLSTITQKFTFRMKIDPKSFKQEDKKDTKSGG